MKRFVSFIGVWVMLVAFLGQGIQARTLDDKGGLVVVKVKSQGREVYQKISEKLHQLKGVEEVSLKNDEIIVKFDKELGCAMKIESALKDMGVAYEIVELHNPFCKCKHCATKCSGKCKKHHEEHEHHHKGMRHHED